MSPTLSATLTPAPPRTTARPARRRLRVGIIELLNDVRLSGAVQQAYAYYLTKQYASVAPQAVSVWCRQLGHDVHYVTYYGQSDIGSLLPKDLDVLFVGSYTRCSGLAYALAQLFADRGTLTVIGGPHAKSYPADCLRYFDLVVAECDKQLVDDILTKQFDTPSMVTRGRPLTDVPTVEERMPEIRASAFNRGRATRLSVVGLLSSVGCPYTCDFCTDWDNKYIPLSADRLEADLRYVADHMPQALVAYHDPNFGVNFDDAMSVMELIEPARRNRYVMESSLAIMKASRLERLRDTNCVFVAPGVESWGDYSNKAGVGSKQGREKLEQVVAHFATLGNYVIGTQANFVFGLDGDRGADPVELTKEFIRRSPRVWPTVNIPTPLGGTPLFNDMHANGRILAAMPLALYFTLHYTVTTSLNYDPVEYYSHLVDLYDTIGSPRMLARRIATRSHPAIKILNAVRTMSVRGNLREFKKVRDLMTSDAAFRAFHEGRVNALPEYYHQRFEERLGAYAELLPRAVRTPVLDPIEAGGLGRSSLTVPRAQLA